MTRPPALLAALASVAVPGLDPVSVQAVVGPADGRFDVAVVVDGQHRRWVVRAPRTPEAAAQVEAAAALPTLVARRLPFSVPVPKGYAPLPDGRATVSGYLPGRPMTFTHLAPGPGLAAEVGRAVAQIHNLDRALYEEAGLPVYDAQTCRARQLTALDRAAVTGHVPASLLHRWERALEDVRLWRFAATPVHGGLDGSAVLAVAEEGEGSGPRVAAILAWEQARIADPAEDFAQLVSEASAEASESVLESYANARVERPDPYLRVRARLWRELRLLGRLLQAVSGSDPQQVGWAAAALRDLDRDTDGDDGLIPPDGPPPAATAPSVSRADDGSSHVADRPGDPDRESDLDTQTFDVAAQFEGETQPILDRGPLDDDAARPERALDDDDPVEDGQRTADDQLGEDGERGTRDDVDQDGQRTADDDPAADQERAVGDDPEGGRGSGADDPAERSR